MHIQRIRIIHGCCDNCKNQLDDKLANSISFIMTSILLCDNCKNGLNEILTKLNSDGLDHHYCSENNTTY